MKKTALLFAFMLLAAVALGGCASAPAATTAPGTSAAATDTPATPAPTEMPVLSFTALSPDYGIKPDGTVVQVEWQKRMEAYIGRKLDIKWQYVPVTGSDFYTKVNLIMNSGDMPDVMALADWMSYDGNFSGMMVNLNDYASSIPNYKRLMEATTGKEKALLASDGKLYGFYRYTVNNTVYTNYLMNVRLDVFETNNIKLPDTIDEFYAACKKLKEIYPDSYPVTGEGGMDNWNAMVAPFAIANHAHIAEFWDGEKFVFGPTLEGYKDALIFFKKLYDEKLLDPEYSVMTEDQRVQKLLTGKGFIQPNAFGNRVFSYNSNETAKVTFGNMLPPKNPKYGEPWYRGVERVDAYFDNMSGVHISTKAKEPETLCKLIDYQYADEMLELMSWGIEGTTFEKSADEKRSFLTSFTTAANPTEELGKLGVGSSYRCVPGFQFAAADNDASNALRLGSKFYFGGKLLEGSYPLNCAAVIKEENMIPEVYQPLYAMTDADWEVYNKVMPAINTAVAEKADKFVKGDISLADLETFLNELKANKDLQGVMDYKTEKYNSGVKLK